MHSAQAAADALIQHISDPALPASIPHAHTITNNKKKFI
jgi:hypothetical protein